MASLGSLIAAITLVSFVPASNQDQFLPVPVSERQEDHRATDATSHDRLSICHFLCRSKRSKSFGKVVSATLCSRECARNKRPGESFSSLEVNTKLKSAISRSRSRRSNEPTQEEDCLKPLDTMKDGAENVEGIKVDFLERKPNLTVKWIPKYDSDLSYNWTAYALIYHLPDIDLPKCVLIPKDRREWVIRDGDDWKYPNTIFLGIVTYPFGKDDRIEQHQYDPLPPAPIIPPPKREGSNKVVVGISGLAAGLVLLFVLVLVYRKRTDLYSFCSKGGDKENDNVMNKINNDLQLQGPEFFYACYYPENDSFQLQVASVVNFFRQNGYGVVMDVMNCNELVHLGPTRWAEQQIKRARKILVFLSPGLLRLCGSGDDHVQYSNQENERVWYELSLLRTIYSQTHSASRMICITMPAKTPIDLWDLPLWAELTYRWPKDKTRILNRLNDRPFIQPC